MTRTKKRRCACGRPAHPDARTARIAAARGTRQSDSTKIVCTPYSCPDGGHHTMLWPIYTPVTFCACGCPSISPLRSAEDLLAYLQRKHPEPENPYTMYRCTDGGIHIARDRSVPPTADRATHTTNTAALQAKLRDTPIHRDEHLGNWR